jgi:hypothetical protein
VEEAESASKLSHQAAKPLPACRPPRVRYSEPMALPNTLALIGNTPLVRLAGPSAAAGCDIFGKCEFANPGASVKDRAALAIVEDAEARGLLQPGGTIVERATPASASRSSATPRATRRSSSCPRRSPERRWTRCGPWAPSW